MKLSTSWIALLVVTFITISPALSSALTLDFEDIAPNTRVTTQFAARGVLFGPGPVVQSDDLARSGTQVLLSASPTTEFNTGPLKIEFTSAQSLVKMFARASFTSITGTLMAFDDAGALVAQDGPKAVATDAYTTAFEVTVPTPTIRRVELLYSSSAFEAIDDLEFQGQPPAELATEPPTIQVLAPADNEQFVDAEVSVLGTVSGPQVISAQLTVEVQRPPGSNAPSTSTSLLQLAGTANLKNFSQVRLVALGPQTLTVTAENSAGKTGSHSVHITYLPQLIRDRVAAEDENTLGDFQFGGSATDCLYAVYQRGAVAELNGRSVVVREPILGKWLSIKDLSGFPTLGCPTSDQRTISGDTAIAQDFQNARIYADANGTFQVPTVFLDAMEARGGEVATLVPIADPSESSGAMKTWLFQRFRRPAQDAHTATLEIRGQPARLYMERIADFPEFSIPSPQSPTIVEDFPCSTSLGPCDVSLPVEEPLADIGRFCNHKHYDWNLVKSILLHASLDPPHDPPEWVAVVGDHAQTPLRGIVRSVKQSDGDNPLTHEHTFAPCPPGPVRLAAWAAVDEPQNFCPSDLGINIVPLPGWKNVLGVGVGSNPNSDKRVHVEYERGHAQAFTAFGGDPVRGALMFVSGRWIIDCGHDYKTEIHPPSVVAIMRTITVQGKPETQARVWVNGFYSGDPVEFDIHPPPRPSPDALLTVSREDSPVGLTIDHTIRASQYVRLRFSASPHQVQVTEAGEMKHEPGRGYLGLWTLRWDR